MSTSAELPFVIEPPGDPALVDRAAQAAARRWGMAPPERLRLSMNGIYEVGPGVVLRVGRTTAPASAAVELHRVLAQHGIRVPRLIESPLDIDGLSAFAVERLDVTGPVDWRAVGEQVARVQRIAPSDLPAQYPVPWCGALPWWQVHDVLDDVAGELDDLARRGMDAVIERYLPALRASRGRADVVCHGDVHPGNVVQTARGPVLIDWDLLCTGPPGWDHAMMLTWSHRWGGEPGTYEAFAEGFGRSLAGDLLAEGIAALRLVIATLMRVRAGRTDPAARAEAGRRLRYWRGELDAPQWRAQ